MSKKKPAEVPLEKLAEEALKGVGDAGGDER
jgi:hypothetical protein